MEPDQHDLSWLPDRHIAVASTLSHADDLIDHVCKLAYVYGVGDETSGPIEIEELPGAGVTLSTIRSVKLLPRALALYAADALTTLRAAVEHTLYAEAEHHLGRVFTGTEERLVEMPAHTTAEKFDGWVEGRRKRKAPASLLDARHVLGRVRALQPYRSPTPQEHPLALLASHTNLAKHRMAALAAGRVAFTIPDYEVAGVKFLPSKEGPAEAGDVLAEVPFGVTVPVSIFSHIAIHRPGTDQWPILLQELGDIATWVRTVAIPTLITGSADVDPLPASIDTSATPSEERATIAAGSWQSAVQRSSIRLGAFTAREDLARLLAAHPKPADPIVIEDWLNSLADQDVVDRTKQLAGSNPSVENAWQMLMVAGGFIEEAEALAAAGAAEEEVEE